MDTTSIKKGVGEMKQATYSRQEQDLRYIGNDTFEVVGYWTYIEYDDGTNETIYTPVSQEAAEYQAQAA